MKSVARLFWGALLLLVLPACTSHITRENLPYPLTNDTFGQDVKVVSIPLPVIAASPNEGVTGGALTAFLLHDRNDSISTLIAPQVNYNENFGITSTLYAAFYPSQERYWEVNLSKSTRVNEDYELRMRDKTLLEKKLELNLFAFAWNDGSARFFGFNAGAPRHQETNYTDSETGFNLSAGYDISRHFQLVAGERFRRVGIRPGAVKGIPYTRDRFNENEVPGLDGFDAHSQRLALIYSTLDSPMAPGSGGYARISFENSLKAMGGAADYRHYEGELKGYVPFGDGRFVSVFRFVYNQTLGDRVPFLEQSILGGENTLRGYGRNRFIDNCYMLLNLEERVRLFRWEVFDVKADWEIAPFIDLGAVMDRVDKAGLRNLEFNPGIGVRAVVRPNIIGRVDVGVGRDGPAVFVGLGHPF